MSKDSNIYNHYKFVKIPDKEEIEKYRKTIVLTTKLINKVIYLYKIGFIDFKILIEIFKEHGINYKKPKYALYWESRKLK